MTHSAKRDYDLAIADYDKAIDLNPKYAFPYRGRAASYTEKRDHDRAAADIDKAIELNPKDAAAYNGRARTYFKAGKAATGLPDVEKSLELRPNNAAALDTRGSIFEVLGRREEAIADFRRALAQDPKRTKQQGRPGADRVYRMPEIPEMACCGLRMMPRGSLALVSLDHVCRDHCPDFSATFTTMAFGHSSSRWLGISDLIA